MRSIVLTIFTAVAAAASSGAAQAAMGGPTERYNCDDATGRYKRNLWLGREGAGLAPEDALRKLGEPGSEPTMDDLHDELSCLESFYLARAGRQQAWLDAGGGLTALGMIGAAFSGGASAMTQTYWAIGGMAPVMTAGINSYEPTRELYEASAIGLRGLRGRYERLDALSEEVSSQLGKAANAYETMEAKCAGAGAAAGRIANWTGTPRDALLEESRRVVRACEEAKLAHRSLENVDDGLEAQKPHLGRYLASDALRFHWEVVNRDRSLHASPRETLSRLAAAPFLSIGSALVGDDAAKTAAGLQQDKVLGGFSVPITRLALAEPRPEPAAIPGLSKTAADVVDGWVKTNAKAKNPPAANVNADAMALDTATTAINEYVQVSRPARLAAAQAHELARYDQLKLVVDSATNQAGMRLAVGETVSPPSPVTAAGAAASSAKPETPSPSAAR